MQIMSRLYRFVVAVFLALLICLTASADIIYVDDSAPTNPTPDGTASKPFRTIQDAWAVASSQNEDVIRVGQGTYTPSAQSSGYIQLKDRVRIEGGYLGWTGSTFDETRDPATYVTILSGDLGGNDNADPPVYTDNAHHVVNVAASTQPPTGLFVADRVNLDGVTISGGRAPYPGGGGIFINGGGAQSTSPVFRNCTIENNATIDDFDQGGGVFASGLTHPVFRQCTFNSNYAGAGAAALFFGGSAGTFLNCTFDSNYALNYGGAVWSCPDTRGINFISCTFVNNHANYLGGAILYNGSATDDYRMRIENCLFVGNTADEGTIYGDGGAVYVSASSNHSIVDIKNCTFTQNEAASKGGAI